VSFRRSDAICTSAHRALYANPQWTETTLSSDPGNCRSTTRRPEPQATLRSRWITLRDFYNWAVEEEEIDASPMARVKVAKASSPPVRVVTDAEVAALLSACSGTAFPERRDAALIRVLAATGVRVSELCSMKVDQIDLPNRIAPVWGKGKKPRYVRFDAETAKALDRYLRARARYRTAHLDDLWIGHRGALTRQGVPSILAKRSVQARAAGHDIGHIHPHAFRHRFAHRWLVNGGTEGDLQRLGGWTSDQVMRRYGSALADDRALAAYDRLKPMANL
jgi:integrase